MKPETLRESIKRENKARLKLIPLGWEHLGNWRFKKNGKVFDFSATDINTFLKMTK